jgi:purine-binding chemotaxis protein CheW
MMAENFILFTLAGTTYALRTRDVAHIEMVEQVTGVPNASPFVDGVVFSRGLVVPAINLRARFGVEKVPYDVRTRLLVVQLASRTIGLIVDSAREFQSIPAEAIQPPGQTLSGVSGTFVEGIVNLGGRLVLVLDLAAVVSVQETLPAA